MMVASWVRDGIERSEIAEPRVVAALLQGGVPAAERIERDHDECPDEIDERQGESPSRRLRNGKWLMSGDSNIQCICP